MTWRMLDFSELQQQPTHVQLLMFSEAYLDSAEALCEQLCSTPDVNYAHGAVSMSLTFHSLELFFKGGIARLCPNEQFFGKAGHDLDALAKRFFRLYPKKEFRFEVPFGHQAAETPGGVADRELAALLAFMAERKQKIPEDQRHRYPIDVEGRPWPEANFAFEPNMFLDTLRELKGVYARLQPQLRTAG